MQLGGITHHCCRRRRHARLQGDLGRHDRLQGFERGAQQLI